MDTFLVPKQLLAAIQAAPTSGINLLLALVENGVVSVNDPVDNQGTTLMSALVNGALHGKPSVWRQANELRAAIFAPAHVQKWMDMSGGKAFSGRDDTGRWVVASLLQTLALNRPASRSASKRSVDASRALDELWSGKKLDPWLACVLPHLPREAWQEVGRDLLVHALNGELPKAIELAWKNVSVLSLDDAGDPALMSARSGRHWDRFLEEGGNPSILCGDAPLWKKMLGLSLRKPPVSFESLAGRFEDWFLANAPGSDEMRPHLKMLLFRRAATADKTPPSHWVKLFEAAGPQSLLWEGGKEKTALWKVACLAHPDVAAFDALEKSSSIMRHLPVGEFETIRLLSLLHQVSAAPNEEHTVRAFSLLENHLDHRGWPRGDVPFAPLFATTPLPRALRERLIGRVRGNEEAWWGPEMTREAWLRDAMLALPKLDRSAQLLDTWLAVFSVKGASSPWLSVGLGVVSAMRGRVEVLEGIASEDTRVVLSDPEGAKMLTAMVKAVPQRHRPLYRAWLESMTLAASAPVPTARRSSVRL